MDDQYRLYPGARPFRQAEQEVFFGRADDARLIAEWWRTNRLTYVVAPAGRGKTSLLHAGVLPLLNDQNLEVLPVGCLSFGITFPLAALPAHNPYALSLLRSWSAGDEATRLAGLTINEYVAAIAGTRPILAAVDPADELVGNSGSRRRHRRDFLADLRAALHADSRLHLLIVGREQAIGMITEVLGNGLRYDLRPLTWQGAVDVVTGPMTVACRTLADGVRRRSS